MTKYNDERNGLVRKIGGFVVGAALLGGAGACDYHTEDSTPTRETTKYRKPVKQNYGNQSS